MVFRVFRVFVFALAAFRVVGYALVLLLRMCASCLEALAPGCRAQYAHVCPPRARPKTGVKQKSSTPPEKIVWGIIEMPSHYICWRTAQRWPDWAKEASRRTTKCALLAHAEGAAIGNRGLARTPSTYGTGQAAQAYAQPLKVIASWLLCCHVAANLNTLPAIAMYDRIRSARWPRKQKC